MSSGAFVKRTYVADNGDLYLIKVQPETLTATFSPGGANAAGSGDPDSGIARVGGSRRKYGLKARGVLISSSAPPTGYKANSPIFLPILTPTVFDAILGTSTVSYQSATWNVVGFSKEGGRVK